MNWVSMENHRGQAPSRRRQRRPACLANRLREKVEITDEAGLVSLCELARELEQKAAESENTWAVGASSFNTGL